MSYSTSRASRGRRAIFPSRPPARQSRFRSSLVATPIAASCAFLLRGVLLLLAPQMDQQERNRRRRDAGNARRLPKGLRGLARKRLAHFDRKAAHIGVV